ncbi:hypothetical protein glysoja_026393 [Glycine soja]|uniref:Uncharacterized protein n=1 Tax=Glycine soja TaxID=3848 RepID=A0A0B2ST55_GLYSO|nr:hypothetical protein glysoja_026393 [Glycine soja]
MIAQEMFWAISKILHTKMVLRKANKVNKPGIVSNFSLEERLDYAVK